MLHPFKYQETEGINGREIANVVLKEIATGKPVLYLETLKTSSTEVTAEAAYARGGPGNPKRLMWESNKEVMYNMQDSLISPESFAMLAGTTVATKVVKVHKKEVLTLNTSKEVTITETPVIASATPMFVFVTQHGDDIGITVPSNATNGYQLAVKTLTFNGVVGGHTFAANNKVIVDYYYDSAATAKELVIEAGKFAGYYRLEADTLWKRESDGVDLPAKFIMPRIKMSSAFTISSAAEGDPSVFDFNCEVFPDSSDRMVIIDIIE